MLKFFSRKEYLLLSVVFLVFIFLRVFSDSPYFFIQGSDHARYLELAKNFPYHTLHNNQLYLYHLPLYPYTIHFLTWFFEDHIAGMMVSLISAIITFFIIYKLTLLLTKERYIAIGVLVLFSLSDIFIISATNVMKESLLVMLTLASIYFFILFLKNNKTKNLVLSILAGVLLGMTTDFVVLLILSLIVICLLYGNKFQWKATMPILATALSYSIWVLIRLYIYTTFQYYPASFDGIIVKTDEWSLMSLISTDNFREIATYLPNALPLGISFDFFHYVYPFIYMFNLAIFPFPSGLKFSNIEILFTFKYLPQLLVYSLLFFGMIYGLYKIISLVFAKKIKYNSMLLVFILLLIFLIPLIQGSISKRFQVQAIIFLFIITNYGLFQFTKTFKFLRLFKAFISILILVLILYLPFYYLENPYFVLSKQKVVEATKTAEFVSQLPKEGVMAQIGYTQELNYLTDKRVMALPLHPDYMFLVEMYNISYLIYGGFYSEPFSENNREKVLNYDTIKYIREHPEKFKLLEVIEERYPPKERTDHIYIYEVIRN